MNIAFFLLLLIGVLAAVLTFHLTRGTNSTTLQTLDTQVRALEDQVATLVADTNTLETRSTLEGTVLTAAQPHITSLGKLTGLDMGGHRAVNVGSPVNTTDAVTKTYADQKIQGTIWLTAVVTKTTTNLASFTGSFETINGVTVSDGDRVLVSAQTDAKENGIYVVGSNQTTLTRAADMDGNPVHENHLGEGVLVTAGAAAGSRWVLTTPDTALAASPIVTVGVDELKWAQFTGPVTVFTDYIAGKLSLGTLSASYQRLNMSSVSTSTASCLSESGSVLSTTTTGKFLIMAAVSYNSNGTNSDPGITLVCRENGSTNVIEATKTLNAAISGTYDTIHLISIETLTAGNTYDFAIQSSLGDNFPSTFVSVSTFSVQRVSD